MISAFDLKLLVFGFLAVCSGLGVSDASGRASAQLASAEAGSHSDGSSDPQAVGGERPLRVSGQGSQQAENGSRPPWLAKSLYRAAEIFVPAFSNLRFQVWKITIMNDVE
jgi:hypothetical protein